MATTAPEIQTQPAAPGAAPSATFSPRRAALRLVPPALDPAEVEAARGQAAPFIKWVGGKGRLLGALDRLRPRDISRYAEPFVGGGAFYYHLWNQGALEHAVLCDLNTDVVTVFETVRDRLDALLIALRGHQNRYHALDDTGRAAYFYEVRARHPDDHNMSPVDRAARMLFLNRTCFNGLWRENRSGRFNTPHGRYKNPVIAPAERLRVASVALHDSTVLQADFRELPELCAREQIDFVYLDPPYHPISATSAFNAYSQGSFSGADQAELADVCRQLDSVGVRFMLSNSDCPLIRELYRDFDICTIQAARAVSCKGDGRGKVSEVVVRNRRPGLAW